jgi:hypothetical protein
MWCSMDLSCIVFIVVAALLSAFSVGRYAYLVQHAGLLRLARGVTLRDLVAITPSIAHQTLGSARPLRRLMPLSLVLSGTGGHDVNALPNSVHVSMQATHFFRKVCRHRSASVRIVKRKIRDRRPPETNQNDLRKCRNRSAPVRIANRRSHD